MRKLLAVTLAALLAVPAALPAQTTIRGTAAGTVPSTRATYVASTGAQATTAAILLSLEAGPTKSIRVTRVCYAASVATAAAAVVVTMRRTTAASSGGTAAVNEGTGTTVVTKLDPASANFSGVARLGGTPGTAGATLDQWGFTAGELGAGAADPPGQPTQCVYFGGAGQQMPTVQPGIVNGISVNVSSHGAGGLAAGAISIEFIEE